MLPPAAAAAAAANNPVVLLMIDDMDPMVELVDDWIALKSEIHFDFKEEIVASTCLLALTMAADPAREASEV